MTATVKVPISDIVRDPRFQPRQFAEGYTYDRDRVSEMGTFDPSRYVPVECWFTDNGQKPSDDCKYAQDVSDGFDHPRPCNCGYKLHVYLLSGFHRIEVAHRSGIQTLDVIPRPFTTIDDAIDYAWGTNSRERPLTPIEEAFLIKRHRERGRSWSEISKLLDQRPTAALQRRESLARLCASVQSAVRDRTLSVDYAEAIGEGLLLATGDDRLSVAAQEWLCVLAQRTKARPAVFRAIVQRITTRKPTDRTGSEFSLLTLAGQASIEEATAYGDRAIEEATRDLKIRDTWHKLAAAGQSLLKSGIFPDNLSEEDAIATIVRVIDLARKRESEINHLWGLGSDSEIATVVTQTDTHVECPIVARPVIKYAGGKADMLPAILPWVRKGLENGTGRLVEPFAGGAAVTLAIAPTHGVLADILPDLANLYTEIRCNPAAIYAKLTELSAGYTDRPKERFLEIRKMEPTDAIMQAARMIFITKHAYNGLWRLNKKGKLNTTWGQKTKLSLPTLADLVTASRALQGVDVRCRDWRDTLTCLTPGDTLFIDSPYASEDPTAFTSYSADRWSEGDHESLATVLAYWAKRSVFVVATQPDIPLVRELYPTSVYELIPAPRPNGWKMQRRKTEQTPVTELVCVSRNLFELTGATTNSESVTTESLLSERSLSSDILPNTQSTDLSTDCPQAVEDRLESPACVPVRSVPIISFD